MNLKQTTAELILSQFQMDEGIQMNLRQTTADLLHNDLKYPRELPWEQEWGVVKEITDPEDLETIRTRMMKPKGEGYLPLEEGHRLYKVTDRIRYRTGYMIVDEGRNELAFWDYPFIY